MKIGNNTRRDMGSLKNDWQTRPWRRRRHDRRRRRRSFPTRRHQPSAGKTRSRRPPPPEECSSIIGAGSVWQGNFSTDGSVRLDGRSPAESRRRALCMSRTAPRSMPSSRPDSSSSAGPSMASSAARAPGAAAVQPHERLHHDTADLCRRRRLHRWRDSHGRRVGDGQRASRRRLRYREADDQRNG